MKTRRKRKLRYNGNILRRIRRERKFQAWMDDFAEKLRAKMESKFVSDWTRLMPANPPDQMGSVLTKGVLDAAADRLGISHP